MESVGDILSRLMIGDTLDRKTSEFLLIEEKPRPLAEELRLPSLENTFAKFIKRKGTEKALNAFINLAEGKTELPFLLCSGGVGNGKTHLVEALILRWWERGILCRYLTCSDILAIIKRGMDKEQFITVEDRVRALSETPQLVLDDIGGGMYLTAWVDAQLENIIDARYRARLITVATTNLDLSKLPERIISRFLDPEIGVVVLNDASDYRRRMFKEGSDFRRRQK